MFAGSVIVLIVSWLRQGIVIEHAHFVRGFAYIERVVSDLAIATNRDTTHLISIDRVLDRFGSRFPYRVGLAGILRLRPHTFQLLILLYFIPVNVSLRET